MFAATADRTLCFCIRLLFFFCLWTVVSGFTAADAVVGAVTAFGAAWVSVLLLPCWSRRIDLFAWVKLLARVPGQALVSGADVARRALDPALPLRPGFKTLTTALPEGTAENTFAAFAALQPGSVPVRKEKPGAFDIHCLDVEAPIAETLAREETRLREAFALERHEG